MSVKARYYDKCDAQNPLRAEIDLDSSERYQFVGNIKHDLPSSEIQVHLDPDSPFKMLLAQDVVSPISLCADEPSSKITAGNEQPIALFVDVEALRKSTNGAIDPVGRLALTEAVKLFSRIRDPERNDVHVSLAFYRSGPPIPNVRLEHIDEINLGAEIVPDETITIGFISLTLDNDISTAFRGVAQFSATISAHLQGEALPVSVRPNRLDSEISDGQWLKFETNPNVSMDLELVQGMASFVVPSISLGIPLRNLREKMSLLRKAPGDRIPLELQVSWSVAGDVRSPHEKFGGGEIDVFGTLNEYFVVSGLCGMAPRRIVLAAQQDDTQIYPFPPIRARLRESGPDRYELFCEPVELQITGEMPTDAFSIGAELQSASGAITIPVDYVELDGRWVFKLDDILKSEFNRRQSDDDFAMTIFLHVKSESAQLDTVFYQYQFEAAVAFEREIDPWTICIDFGTSSVAIWIGRGPEQNGHQLRLGTWLSSIDPYHPESAIWRAAGSGNTDSYLLPSYIGLAREVNIRADYDPLSLGNLALSFPGPEAEQARLNALDLTYDVSLPFPASSLVSQFSGSIVSEPKRRMIMRKTRAVLDNEAAERLLDGAVQATREIDLAKLMEDCFGELGSFAVPRSAHQDLQTAPHNRILSQFLDARIDPKERFRIVITHPCGVDNQKREIYRRSGERFLEKFTGRPHRSAGSVVLVAEAFAAARFGIASHDARLRGDRRLVPRPGQKAKPSSTYIALDLGAGTFDATVITTDAPSAESWHVDMHFGLVVGGCDLDKAILRRIATILASAANSKKILSVFDIRLQSIDSARGANVSSSPMQNRLELEFQAAKARLNSQLTSGSEPGYVWKRRSEGGVPLEIKIGDSSLKSPSSPPSQWPAIALTSTMVEYDIEGFAAQIAFENRPAILGSGGGMAGRFSGGQQMGESSIILKIWRDAFDGTIEDNPDGLEELTELMGSELPKCALAQVPRTADRSIAIVTGRTALWPPLHEKIADAIGSSAVGGEMLMPKPFTPEQMKQAIVRGAVTLARETHGNDEIDAFLDNPIAIVTFRIDPFESGKARHSTGMGRVIDKIIILIDGKRSDDVRTIDIVGSFVIARILPGIDREEGAEERHQLFQRIKAFTGISPIIPLTSELQNPVPGPRRGATWTVKWSRDLLGWRIVFEADNQKTIEFGPFSTRRVYVPE